jgi:ATP-dependent DNA helicase PIF1
VILLKNIDSEKGLVNGSRGLVVDFQKATKNSADLPREFRSSLLPVVQFESACKKNDCLVNENDLCILVEPVEWASKVGDTIVCSRTQIPLRLAWALSVSQKFFYFQKDIITHLTKIATH